MKLTALLTILASIAYAEKVVADKALNWEILARHHEAQTIQAQIETLQRQLMAVNARMADAVKRACEAEGIKVDECAPRATGDVVTLAEMKKKEGKKQ